MDSLCKRCGGPLSSKKKQEEKPVVLNMGDLPDKAKDVETSPPETPENESAIGSNQPTAVQKEKTKSESICKVCQINLNQLTHLMASQLTKKMNHQVKLNLKEGKPGLIEDPGKLIQEVTSGFSFSSMVLDITKQLNPQKETAEVMNKEDLQDEAKADATTPQGASQNETVNKLPKKESVHIQPNDTPPTTPGGSASSAGLSTESGDVDSIDSMADAKSKESGTSGKSSTVDNTNGSCDSSGK